MAHEHNYIRIESSNGRELEINWNEKTRAWHYTFYGPGTSVAEVTDTITDMNARDWDDMRVSRKIRLKHKDIDFPDPKIVSSSYTSRIQ